MPESDYSIPKVPLPLNPYDIKRICVVHWEDKPLVDGQISSYVYVKPLREAEPLPDNQGILKIEGEWFTQLTKGNAEKLDLGDQINVIFSHKDGRIRWLERRDKSQPDSTINKGFT